MPSAGFETAIPAIGRILTYTLDDTATCIFVIRNCSVEKLKDLSKAYMVR
jgi:hypothetical protein